MATQSGITELEVGGETLLVEWRYSPGTPDSRLQPGDPPETEIVSVKLQHTVGTATPSTFQFDITDLLRDLSALDAVQQELEDSDAFPPEEYDPREDDDSDLTRDDPLRYGGTNSEEDVL